MPPLHNYSRRDNEKPASADGALIWLSLTVPAKELDFAPAFGWQLFPNADRLRLGLHSTLRPPPARILGVIAAF